MNLIVAVDSQWGIGYQDRLLFRIKEDQQRFKALTVGKTVILGRRTLETFPGGRPLGDRTNIIFTRSPTFSADPALVCHSLAELKLLLRSMPADDIFVIGGSSVYQLLLPYCRLAYVTRIDCRRPADCYFPDLGRLPGWELVSCEDHQADNARVNGIPEPVPLKFSYCLYRQDPIQEWA